jgi:hypothetical protein
MHIPELSHAILVRDALDAAHDGADLGEYLTRYPRDQQPGAQLAYESAIVVISHAGSYLAARQYVTRIIDQFE